MINLTTEDILELKAAGFPQKSYLGATFLHENYSTRDQGIPHGTRMVQVDANLSGVSLGIYIPTLADLIEECGKDLWTAKQGSLMGKNGWIVGKPKFIDGHEEPNPFMWEIHAFGESLEQAVKNLWIKLNKK